MKNRVKIFALAAATLLSAGCQKERIYDGMMIFAEGFDNSQKLAVNGTASNWADGDRVRINGQEADVTVAADKSYVTLGTGVSSPYCGVYPSSIYSRNSGVDYVLDLPDTYTYATTDGMQNLQSPMVGYTTDASTMTFKHLTAAVTVQVVNYHYDYAIVVDSIEVTSNNYKLCGEMTVSLVSDITVTPEATDDASLRSVKMIMSSGITVAAGDSTAVQVPVLPAGDGNKFTVTVWAHRADKADVAVALSRTQNTGGSLLRANLGYARYTLGGTFSVSSSKKVIFSSGNLQYMASTATWRFAENQYDYIGSSNANISDSYDGWIDLFGWGTGNNPTNTSTDVTNYTTFNEWGANMVTGWFTLNGDEWDYMMKTISANPGTNCRSTKTYGLPTITDAQSARYIKAEVESVSGLIVFPDAYVHPAGVTVTYDKTSAFNYSYNGYSKFVVTAGWDKMEMAGAVFLPAAGERQGTTINNAGTVGNYYASTYTGTSGYHVYFQSSSMNSIASSYPASNKSYGYAVRLVREVE